MASAQFGFYLGLGSGPLAALTSIAWTDISPWVQEADIRRGRQHELNRFQAGTARLLLNSRDGRFDPTNAAGPYYPGLLPMTPLRVLANWPSLLTPDQATMVCAAPAWAPSFNCSLARTTAQALSGDGSLQMTAAAAGTMQAFASPYAGPPVVPGATYTFLCSFRPATAARSVRVKVTWLDASGGLLGSSTGASAAESAGAWTQASVTAAALNRSATAHLEVAVLSAAPGEVHYVDAASLHPGSSTAFAAPYPLYLGYADGFPATWRDMATETVEVAATDFFKVLRLASLGASPWASEIVHSKPKAWLRMGDTGPTAVDSSGNGYDGAYAADSGVIAQGVKGFVAADPDGAADFAHTAGQRVVLPYPSLISGYPFTFECIFKAVPNRAERRFLLAAYDGSSNPRQGVEVYMTDNGDPGGGGQIRLRIFTPSGSFAATSAGAYDDANPHYLKVSAPSAGSASILVDGATSMTSSGTSPFPSGLVTGYAVGNTPAVAFGDYGFGDGANFNGGIDEVVVTERAVGTAEAVNHYYGYLGYGSGLSLSDRISQLLWLLGTDPAADPGIRSTTRLEQSLAGTAGNVALAPGTSAGSMLAEVQSLEQTENGAFFAAADGYPTFYNRYHNVTGAGAASQAVFGTSPSLGELVYEGPVVWGVDDLDIWNEVSVARVQGPGDASAPKPQVVGDAASQAAYGKRTLSVSGLWLGRDSEARDLGNFLLAQYRQPVARVRQLAFQAQDDPASLFPQLLGRELRDRCTIKLRPPGGAPAFVQDSLIEGISHSVRQGSLRTTYAFSALPATPYLVLDDAALGALDANALCY